MSLIIWVVAAIVVFCLLWYAVKYVPAEAPSFVKPLLYGLLLLVAAYIVYTKFMH